MFKKAEKKKVKAKIAFSAPSGGGKSYSSLLIAKGLGGKIAAVDTERGSLSLYSNVVDFDVVEMHPPYTPEKYIQAIEAAEDAGYDTLIIDSLSHEWMGKGGLLEAHGNMPGNSYANWRLITPRHQKLIDTMLSCKLHIIATMRAKTEYLQTESNGKKKIEKMGFAPQQREGMDYEFTLMLDLQRDTNIASADKDRTGLWKDRFEMITVDHGKEILAWLNDGAEVVDVAGIKKPVENKTTPTPKPQQKPKPKANEKLSLIANLGGKCGYSTPDDIKSAVSVIVKRDIASATELTDVECDNVISVFSDVMAQSKDDRSKGNDKAVSDNDKN